MVVVSVLGPHNATDLRRPLCAPCSVVRFIFDSARRSSSNLYETGLGMTHRLRSRWLSRRSRLMIGLRIFCNTNIFV